MRGVVTLVASWAVGLCCATGHAQNGVDAVALREAVPFGKPKVSMNVGSITLGSRPPMGKTRLEALRRSALEHPQDIAAVLRLGRALSTLEESRTEAGALFQRALDLSRKELAGSPLNGIALARRGEAQAGLGNFLAAEESLRRAVELSPDRWETWTALGDFLSVDSIRQAMDGPTAEERVRVARKVLEEARSAYDSAVRLGPAECEPLVGHAMFGMVLAAVFEQLGLPGAHSMDPREVVKDLWSAASSCGDWPEVVTYAVWAEVMAIAGEADLPEAIPREKVSVPLELLEALTSAPEDPRAPVAEECSALLLFAARDFSTAAEHAERALTLDPARELAAEVLMSCLAEAGKFPEAAALCESQIERAGSPRWRIHLASVHAQGGDWEKSLEAARLAYESAPGDVPVNVALTAALLRSPASRHLRDAAEALRKLSDVLKSSKDPREWLDYALLRAIYMGLSGKVEAARKDLEEILAENPDNKNAKAALEALDSGELPMCDGLLQGI